jgi:hypothetical protein
MMSEVYRYITNLSSPIKEFPQSAGRVIPVRYSPFTIDHSQL